eukprot:TRINITY_DN3542_c0_g1_i1.p1 TRINITY_DN3542_c0_g1~~TRINITY_DN3542_c0_g1_i1.p1  ORF type:complete len:155 (-),score=59.23 TRINITY_DN3542_c0_g1_i1:175-585(-)
MNRFTCFLFLVICLSVAFAGKLRIKTLHKPEVCDVKTKNGDELRVHYRGYLKVGRKEFDNSYQRGEPLPFVLGRGQVIKGWEQGLLDMCVGEKRKIIIPPELGYGSHGAGSVIPPDATLVFVTELVRISPAPKDEI